MKLKLTLKTHARTHAGFAETYFFAASTFFAMPLLFLLCRFFFFKIWREKRKKPKILIFVCLIKPQNEQTKKKQPRIFHIIFLPLNSSIPLFFPSLSLSTNIYILFLNIIMKVNSLFFFIQFIFCCYL